MSLVPRLLRGTWLWDKLLPLQHLESDCPWVSAWSTEEWLPLTTCGHRKPCFIKMSPPPPISLFIDPRKPGVCLKGCGIQTKEPLPPTSYPGPGYRKSPTSSALPGQHCRPDLGAEQKLRSIEESHTELEDPDTTGPWSVQTSNTQQRQVTRDTCPVAIPPCIFRFPVCSNTTRLLLLHGTYKWFSELHRLYAFAFRKSPFFCFYLVTSPSMLVLHSPWQKFLCFHPW